MNDSEIAAFGDELPSDLLDVDVPQRPSTLESLIVDSLAMINGSEEDLALHPLLHPPPTGQVMAASPVNPPHLHNPPSNVLPPPLEGQENDAPDDSNKRGSGSEKTVREAQPCPVPNCKSKKVLRLWNHIFQSHRNKYSGKYNCIIYLHTLCSLTYPLFLRWRTTDILQQSKGKCPTKVEETKVEGGGGKGYKGGV